VNPVLLGRPNLRPLAGKVLLALPERQDLLAHKDPRVRKATVVLMEYQESPAQSVQWAQPARPVKAVAQKGAQALKV
jgi:hypothetical protein